MKKETNKNKGSSKINGGLYIDPVFSKKQKYIWTGDKFDGSKFVLRVYFDVGYVNWGFIYDSIFVRPVRSVE